MKGEDFANEIKKSSMVKLYEMGKVSSGTAAKVLGITRWDFLDLLANYNISVIQYGDLDDLKEDIANA